VLSWGSGTPLDSHVLSLPLPQENTLVWEPCLQHFTHFITNCHTMHTTYFGRPKRLVRKHQGGLPSALGEEWYALLHSRKPKTSLGKSNPPWCIPHFRNEKLRCM
jgi:hypothetical protein